MPSDASRSAPSPLLEAAGPLLFWLLLAAAVLVVMVLGPIATSDGPAHVAIAHAITVAGDPAWPMVNRLYDISPILTPNALGHYLLAALMLILSPAVAEQTIQILCIGGVPLAGWLLLRRLHPSAGWLALLLFPVALQATFLMGLYNYSLSISFCLLSIWAYLRLRERATAGAALLLAFLLLVTLASQAPGWIEAIAAIGTMTGVETGLRWLHGRNAGAMSPGASRGKPLREPLAKSPGAAEGTACPDTPLGTPFGVTLRLLAMVLASSLPSLLLFLWFMRQSTGFPTVYGPSLVARLIAVILGQPFSTIGRATALSSLLLMVLIIGLCAAGLLTWLRNPARSAASLRLGVLLVPVAFLAVLAVIPDEAGGGWTHTWRAQPFPLIGLVLACAVLPLPPRLRFPATLLAAAIALVSIGMVAKVQAMDLPPVLREFNEVDGVIPPHCTIAPVLSQFKLDPANRAQLVYHPLFHAASRFELRDDRPVLFSYVARLPVYPARFRPAMDPQRLLYGWQPFQRDTHVVTMDIPRFEAATGLPVDFVLLWDVPDAPPAGPFAQIRRDIDKAGYRPVFRSSGGRMEAFRRPGTSGCGPSRGAAPSG
ncbi:hypothetical protein [Rhodopila sp.]|uniref:hypothetical protein n=1 Tax=Rhodopila sp. TaxID=2480087 RepID=UPI002C31B85E|nr:hypothetical protein [Rhodopila sp.]HVZ07702.1 hypothetical protein [Rhodopila sp.]